MKIHTPNLKALKYVGQEPQRFKQLVAVRVFPILENGDIVIVPELTAHMMRKNKDFEAIDLNVLLSYIPADVFLAAEELTQAQAAQAQADAEAAQAAQAQADAEAAQAAQAQADAEAAQAAQAQADAEAAQAAQAQADAEAAQTKAPKKPKGN
jgi:uncharacterized membrane protein YqiK